MSNNTQKPANPSTATQSGIGKKSKHGKLNSRRPSRTEQKRAISVYVLTGSFEQAADDIGFTDRSVRNWSKEPWWQVGVQACEHELRNRTAGTYRRVLTSALEAIEDRVINGDYHQYHGETIRKPLSARDLSVVVRTMGSLSKAQPQQTTTTGLQSIAKQFDQYAGAYLENKAKPTIDQPVCQSCRACLPA